MTSDELNAKLRAIDDAEGGLDFDAFGNSGKRLPYIGWFWRDVDWSRDDCVLGIIPRGADGNDKPLVGFMESNKWGYPHIYVCGPAWTNIRDLATQAATSPSIETLRALNEAVQALGEGGAWAT